jgi:hypothetical protein
MAHAHALDHSVDGAHVAVTQSINLIIGPLSVGRKCQQINNMMKLLHTVYIPYRPVRFV